MNTPRVMTIIETEEGFFITTNISEVEQTRFLKRAYEHRAEIDHREMEKFKSAYIGRKTLPR